MAGRGVEIKSGIFSYIEETGDNNAILQQQSARLETKELVELFPSVQGTQIQPLRQIL
jgi:hypothetical protein